MKLTGDLVKVYTAKEDTSVDHVNATGTPSKRPHVEQIDDNGNLMTGDADQLYYDDVNGIAILIGNAFVHHQNQGEAQGPSSFTTRRPRTWWLSAMLPTQSR
jgi:lipopolysaccharide export system protein LptA